MLSFTFAGKNSYIDYGINIVTRPTLPSPKRKVHYTELPGRHSRVTYDEKTYEDITIAVECSIVSDNITQRIDEIKEWLLNATESDLFFSFQRDKIYKAQVVNSIDFTQVLKLMSSFIILFNCKPFKYSVTNSILTITQASNIINPGSIYSEPIIKVTGIGNIEININGSTVSISELDGEIIINSQIMDAYDVEINNMNHKILGDFLTLEPGVNNISFTGDVSSIEILPNWRWL